MRSLLDPPILKETLTLYLPPGCWHLESNMIWGAVMWDSNLYQHDPHTATGAQEVAVIFQNNLSITMNTSLFVPSMTVYQIGTQRLVFPPCCTDWYH